MRQHVGKTTFPRGNYRKRKASRCERMRLGKTPLVEPKDVASFVDAAANTAHPTPSTLLPAGQVVAVAEHVARDQQGTAFAFDGGENTAAPVLKSLWALGTSAAGWLSDLMDLSALVRRLTSSSADGLPEPKKGRAEPTRKRSKAIVVAPPDPEV